VAAGKLDPRLYFGQNRVRLLTNLCYAASIGDCYEIQRIIAQGIDVNSVRGRSYPILLHTHTNA
jgi:hypothetical protein